MSAVARGAPIIPLLLLRPDVSALCLEPLGKRATFLRTASARLGLLSRMRVLPARVDLDAPQAFGEVFDLACSRATFAPERWLEVRLRLAPRVLVMTASASPPAPPGSALVALRTYALPFSGAPRRAALYLRG